MAKYQGKFTQSARQAAQREAASHSPAQSAYKATPQKERGGLSTPVRIVLIFLVVILILSSSVVFFAGYYLSKLNKDIYEGNASLTYADLLDEEEITNVEDSTEVIEKVWEEFEVIKDMPMIDTSKADITNYLLIGSDTRGGSNGNSDTMMIVSVNKTTKKIHITSLMRACFVIYPENSGARYQDGMLNWSYSWGGPKLLIDTVELNFKVDIDHFVAVDFESFRDVVDAMGGVDIELTEKEAWYVNNRVEGSYLQAGVQRLNGEQALEFSRCRGAETNDNDFKRTNRQRDVIEAMIHRVGSLGISELTALANTLLPAITTDMSNTAILAEVVNVPDYVTYDMDQMLIPLENQGGETYTGMMHKYGAEMYAIDWNTNLPALENFIMS